MTDDVRTAAENLPEHLQPPFEDVVASHAGPDGLLWELEDGRYLDPSHLLVFAREHGRPPGRTEWLGILKRAAAETKDGARFTPD